MKKKPEVFAAGGLRKGKVWVEDDFLVLIAVVEELIGLVEVLPEVVVLPPR